MTALAVALILLPAHLNRAGRNDGVEAGAPIQAAVLPSLTVLPPRPIIRAGAASTFIPPGNAEGGPTNALPLKDYTVAAGDSLWTLASRFHTDVASIATVNGLNDSNMLQIGQRIEVPTEVGWVYSVNAGETLTAVARLTSVTTAALRQANHLGANATLQIGQRLWIPHEPPSTGPSSGGASSHGTSTARSQPTRTAAPPAVRPAPPRRVTTLEWPVRGPITSPFGWRYLFGRRDFHEGIDIGVPTGTPVHAATFGTVIGAGWDGPFGLAVHVRQGDRVFLYAHNSRLLVHVGETVATGQVLAYSGMTGNATGPHVHFGIYVNGVPVNPMHYLP